MLPFGWFFVNNILAAFICLNTSHLLFKKESVFFRIWSSLSIFPILILFGVLLLGSAGILSATSFSIGLLLVALFLSFVNSTFIRNIVVQVKTIRGFRVIIVVLLATLVVFLYGKYVSQGTQPGPDGLAYHSWFCANVIQSESLLLPKVGLQDFFPYNAEILSIWFMLPFSNDTFVFIAPLIWYALLLSTVFYLISYNTNNLRISACGTLLVGMSFPIVRSCASFSSVDMAGPTMLLVSLVFLLKHIQKCPHRISGFLVLAGFAAGYACGCKSPFLLPGICLPLLSVLLFRKELKNNFWLLPTGFFIAMMVTCGFWYVRNFIETLNPLFPAEVSFFNGPLKKAYLERTTILYQLSNSSNLLSDMKYMYERFADWPQSFWLISMLGYLTALISNLFRINNRHKHFMLLLMLIGLLFFLNHFFTPFSGANHSPNPVFRVSTRFIILFFLLGIVLFCSLSNIHYRVKNIIFILCCAALVLYKTTLLGIVFSLGLIVALFICPYLWDVFRKRFYCLTKECYLLSALVGILFGLCLAYTPLRIKANKMVFDHTQQDIRTGQAWRQMEIIPESAVISWFGGPYPYESYPYFGRDLQFTPISVDMNGLKKKRLYSVWEESEHQLNWWDRNRSPFDQHVLVANLIKTGIEYVVVIKTSPESWPAQKETLDQDSRCQIFSENEISVIYKLLDQDR